MKIKSISLYFPMSTEGELVHYVVGKGEVTSIKPTWKSGVFCYSIYKNERLDSELYHYSHISYEIE